MLSSCLHPCLTGGSLQTGFSTNIPHVLLAIPNLPTLYHQIVSPAPCITRFHYCNSTRTHGSATQTSCGIYIYLFHHKILYVKGNASFPINHLRGLKQEHTANEARSRVRNLSNQSISSRW